MIISASRRTDIPSFYSDWFINRLKEGFCTVPNPFNSKQISKISLLPNDVDVIVFWTRNPKPLMKYLDFIEERGFKYYFQITLNNFPKIYEKHNPSFEASVKNFIALAERIGPELIIWRYDPIFITDDLTVEFHNKNFNKIIESISGFTSRLVISIVDDYKKTDRRMMNLNTNYRASQENRRDIKELLKNIVEKADKHNIITESCAEEIDLQDIGIKHGKCIDDEFISANLGIDLKYKKDKGQRAACGCMISRDIGMNNTCLMGCEYCYATISHQKAISNFNNHDINFSSILKHEIPEDLLLKFNSEEKQLGLF